MESNGSPFQFSSGGAPQRFNLNGTNGPNSVETVGTNSPKTQPFAFRASPQNPAAVPMNTLAYASVNTGQHTLESFPRLSSSPTAAGVTRPISCPARGGVYSDGMSNGYNHYLHQGLIGSPGSAGDRLSSSPNNFSNTRHTQTASYFSQSNSAAATSVTGTGVLWGSGVNPYSSQGYSGNQSLANKIANSLSKYRSVPIKRKSDQDWGSPMKVYLSEKKMAARLENLSISDNKRSLPVSMKEIDDRFSSDDEDDDVVEDGKPSIKISKDLSEKLKKQAKDDILPKSILESIATDSCKPCMEIVLWKPPGGMVPRLLRTSVEAEDDDDLGDSGLIVVSPDISMDDVDSLSTPAVLGHSAMDSSAMPLAETAAVPIPSMDSMTLPPAGAAGSVTTIPLAGSQGFLGANAMSRGGASDSLGSRNNSGATSMMNGAANFTAAVPQSNISRIPTPQQQFLENNNNCISQQDLFDALDDDMDL